MGKAVSALLAGFEYQERFFWLEAARLLKSDSPIKEVSFERGEPKGFDDLGVLYQTPIKDGTGRDILGDYYQLKWHETEDGSIGYEDLIDPSFINAKHATLLGNLRHCFDDAPSRPEVSRFTFVTVWPIRSGDPLAKLVCCNAGELRFDRLFDGTTSRSQMGKVRETWKSHLSLTSDFHLREVLSLLRIRAGKDTYRDLSEKLSDRLETCGMRPLSMSESADIYVGHYNKLLRQGRVVFTSETFLDYCQRENLLMNSGKSLPDSDSKSKQIGIRSFLPFSDEMEEDTSVLLCLTRFFRERYIDDPGLWNSEIRHHVTEFIRREAVVRQPISLVLNAHSSIAFLSGDVFGPKLEVQVAVCQRVQGRFMSWEIDPADAPSQPANLEFSISELDPQADGIALAISLAHETKPNVENYIKQSNTSVRFLLHCQASPTPSRAFVRNGTHAFNIAEAISRNVRALRDEKFKSTNRPMVHIFSAAPNAFMFFLGQFRTAMGRVRLYEFDFEGHETSSYTPSLTLE